MIKLKNINKVFDLGSINQKSIFTNFNLQINSGDFACIIGSNGSGKTSLLNCICGSTNIDSGQILFDGQDFTNIPEFKRYKNIGRVYQNPAYGTCPNLTILENLSLAGNKGRRYGLSRCVNKENITTYKEKLEKLGLGLENKINAKVSTLSGGERQAIALIMVTLTAIDFLILDEHTAALDPKTAETIMKITDEIVRENNITTLMITHNLNYAMRFGNRLIMMKQGKIDHDISGKAKKGITLEEIINYFNNIETNFTKI